MDKSQILTKGIICSPATDYVVVRERGDVVDIYLKDRKTDAVRSCLIPSPSKDTAIDYFPMGYSIEFH